VDDVEVRHNRNVEEVDSVVVAAYDQQETDSSESGLEVNASYDYCCVDPEFCGFGGKIESPGHAVVGIGVNIAVVEQDLIPSLEGPHRFVLPAPNEELFVSLGPVALR